MPYIVAIAHYEDDYKHRYDNSVHPQSPKLFFDKKNAEKFVANYIFDNMDCNKNLLEMRNLFKKNIEKIIVIDNNEWEFQKDIKDDFELMEDIYYKLCVGIYVDYIFDYNIYEVIFEDSCQPDCITFTKNKNHICVQDK
jgi:hypothetical protein